MVMEPYDSAHLGILPGYSGDRSHGAIPLRAQGTVSATFGPQQDVVATCVGVAAGVPGAVGELSVLEPRRLFWSSGSCAQALTPGRRRFAEWGHLDRSQAPSVALSLNLARKCTAPQPSHETELSPRDTWRCTSMPWPHWHEIM